MKVSTKNRLAGTYHEMKGSVRVAIGNTLNNRRAALAGRVEKVAGSVQAKFGTFERILGW